jgi:hypothetical protein
MARCEEYNADTIGAQPADTSYLVLVIEQQQTLSPGKLNVDDDLPWCCQSGHSLTSRSVPVSPIQFFSKGATGMDPSTRPSSTAARHARGMSTREADTGAPSDTSTLPVSPSTTLSELVRQLRGQGSPEALSAAAQEYIDNVDYGAYNHREDEPSDFRDYDTVSSLSRMSTTTDVIILSDPEYGGGQILSLKPPQADEASVDGPVRPMRSIAVQPPATTPVTKESFDTVTLSDGVMKTRHGVHPLNGSADEEVGSNLSKGSDEILHSPGRPWGKYALLLCLVFIVSGVAVYLPVLFKDNEDDTGGSTSNKDLLSDAEAGLDRGSDLTSRPTQTASPTRAPSTNELPDLSPTTHPTLMPTATPTEAPSVAPSGVPSLSPTLRPTAAPTTLEAGLLSVLIEASPNAESRINTPGSPQRLAFEWLLENTQFSLHSRQRILQRYVMVILYYATNGDTWSRNDQWLVGADECLWYNRGLPPCTTNGDLVFLELQSNHLVGELPDELGLLTDLIDLNFSGNDIVGPIPTTLGLLKKLEKLALSGTNINGAIPVELGQATALERINLVGTSVSGAVPLELGNLGRLEELLLAQTSLNGVMPNEICALNAPEVWADCDVVTCPCCNYCCYGGAVQICQYV